MEPSAAKAANAEPVLSLRHASKSFGAVRALQDVSIDLYPGEAHGLVGENGAGKSTLVKILAGVHQPDEGTLEVAGHELVLTGPAGAIAAGVAIIYQEPTLFPDLSVAENVFIGRQPLRRGRRINHRVLRSRVLELFERLGVALDPERIARGLSIAEQQLVEIAKALTRNARVLIMDEPTAALGVPEQRKVMELIATLKAQGVSVILISHNLHDIFAIADRIVVLRRGEVAGERQVQQTNGDEVVHLMVGDTYVSPG
jgi:rhamnose transport system ATP-binding protein